MSEVEKKSTTEGKDKKKRERFWSDLSYTTRMTVSFASIAAMTALVAFGVLSFVWERSFQDYTLANLQSTAVSTANNIAKRYDESGGVWDDHTITSAKYTYSVSKNLGIRVSNAEGATVWDSTIMLIESASNQPDGGVAGSPQPLIPVEPERERVEAPIKVDGQTVGTVAVWVYGTDTLLRDQDVEFRDNSYQAMILAAAIAIMLALCIGYLFARNLVRPINRMTTTAKAIADGDMSARTDLHGDDEIARLGEMFDAMADSVEKDRALERRLTTDVAHELRTPLMAIQSTVEAMVDGVFKADTERLETVNSEVQRLSRLVDALLKLSRLENRSSPMKDEVVDMGTLVSGIVATHEAFVIDSGLTMEYQMQDNVLVYGDSDMIRQATANLISNAVRYTPEGGCITVSVKRGDIMGSIAVKDTGIGLSPEEVKMVFSRFWRADAGRNRESGGLGIGLAVVKEIVDRHGGWVHVEGKPNEGATFTIYIPLYDENRVKIKAKNKEKAKSRPKK